MADRATQQMRVEAPRSSLWDVLVDFEAYPTWARDIKEAKILERDDDGRPAKVLFRAAAMGRSTTYTLAYDWSDAPDALRWELVEGDVMRTLDGSYEFVERDGGTDVTYHLRVELTQALPAFVKRRAEARLLTTALRSLRAHVSDR